MKAQFIVTNNVKKLMELADTLIKATSGEPRLGLVFGVAGLGKTRGVDHLATQTGACYVSAARVWTPSSMLKAILRDLGQPTAVSAAENLERAAMTLADRIPDQNCGNGLLIIDEADYLVGNTRPPATPPLLDTVRDLHDRSGAPIILVGMDHLAQTLSIFAQFWDRVLTHAEFTPISAKETAAIARDVAGFGLTEEVAQEMRRATEGNLRQTILYLVKLERRLSVTGGKEVPVQWIMDIERNLSRRKQRLAGSGRRLRRVK